MSFNKNIPIRISINNRLTEKISIKGNSFLLSQILISLIDNARDKLGDDFTSKKVILELTEKDRKCFLTMSDSSQTSKEDNRIFSVGYTSKNEHYGMGLPAAKYLLEQYFNGEISLLNGTDLFQIQISIPVG